MDVNFVQMDMRWIKMEYLLKKNIGTNDDGSSKKCQNDNDYYAWKHIEQVYFSDIKYFFDSGNCSKFFEKID